MSRGSNTLFADIFDEPVELGKQRRGRSADLIEKRNECLVDRYYFFGKFDEKRYSIILQTLSYEFFLSAEFTIPEIINRNYDQLQQLKNDKPTINYFKKKWPHLVW